MVKIWRKLCALFINHRLTMNGSRIRAGWLAKVMLLLKKCLERQEEKKGNLVLKWSTLIKNLVCICCVRWLSHYLLYDLDEYSYYLYIRREKHSTFSFMNQAQKCPNFYYYFYRRKLFCKYSFHSSFFSSGKYNNEVIIIIIIVFFFNQSMLGGNMYKKLKD